MKNNKGFTFLSVVVIGALILATLGYFFYIKYKTPEVKEVQSITTATTIEQQKPLVTTDDLKIDFIRINPVNNSAAFFKQLSSTTFSKSDIDFLGTYTSNVSSKKLPPPDQLKKFLANYNNAKLIKLSETHLVQPYQCSPFFGDVCDLSGMRRIAQLQTLRVISEIQQKKIPQAESDAMKVVLFGRNITAHADEVITLLVGWVAQKMGYETLRLAHQGNSSPLFTDDEKNAQISMLRNEHKNVFKYMYVRQIEFINYLTSSSTSLSRVINSDEQEMVDIYRKGIKQNPLSWNPEETKQYFHDSYTIDISNIDMECGAKLKDSKIDIGFSQATPTTAENYIGKMLYSTVYAELSTLSSRRCDVENVIRSF